MGDISVSANNHPPVSVMDSVSVSGVNNMPVLDDLSKNENDHPIVSAMDSVSVAVFEHLTASQTDSNSQQTVESGYQSTASTGNITSSNHFFFDYSILHNFFFNLALNWIEHSLVKTMFETLVALL